VSRFALLAPLRAPIVSAALMALAVLAVRRFGIWVAIPTGALVYVGALALQRGIPWEIFRREAPAAARE
jgi:hypothetical protein